MRKYDSAILKTQFIFAICFFSLFWIFIYLLPDYIRSMSCTETAYATVIDVESNNIGKRVVSYNYTVHILTDTVDRVVGLRNYKTLYRKGDYVPIEFRPDGSVHRIPNKFY